MCIMQNNFSNPLYKIKCLQIRHEYLGLILSKNKSWKTQNRTNRPRVDARRDSVKRDVQEI